MSILVGSVHTSRVLFSPGSSQTVLSCNFVDTHLPLYLLWGVWSSTDVADQPTAVQLADFQRKFATAEAWDKILETLDTNHSALDKIRQLRITIGAGKGPIAKDILALEDTHFTLIFSTVLSAGFSVWRPDVLG